MILRMLPVVHFCQRCGACCRWEGDVCIEDAEVEAIASFLGMEAEAFVNECCRLRANRQGLSIREGEDGACMMLEEGGCRIQAVKPAQCAAFPRQWNFPGWEKLCPGAGKCGVEGGGAEA